jgi:DNA-directed RNA polymerase I subunit RPA2
MKLKSQYGHMQFPSSTAEEWASEMLKGSVFAHIESFNTFTRQILPNLPTYIPDVYFTWSKDKLRDDDVDMDDASGLTSTAVTGQLVRLWVESISLGKPVRGDDSVHPLILPADCREGHQTYAAPVTAVICAQVMDDGSSAIRIESIIGMAPIMVGSAACNLHNLSPSQLVARKEDPDERGGYFIINGNEKVCRLLIQPKTNHILAVTRSAFQNRGPLYSKFATQMRCLRPDLTTQTVSLHYRKDGTCWLRFSYLKSEYLLPMVLILHALCEVSDLFIFQQLVDGEPTESFVTERVVAMMDLHAHEYPHVLDRESALAHLGEVFGVVLPEGRLVQNGYMTKKDLGALLIKRMFFVHTENNWEKFQTLVLMFRKLVAVVSGRIRPDNPDAFDCHDVMTPGQLYGGVMKESVHGIIERLAAALAKKSRMMAIKNNSVPRLDSATVKVQLSAVSDLSRKLEYFMATGNLQSRTGLDLQQTSGFTIIADKLNAFRYMSHFRSVHRGAYFAEMKTTTVRKLLPETWGFLCPVHTPDGSPCGLLTHLSALCRPVVHPIDRTLVDTIHAALISAGMVSTESISVYRNKSLIEMTESTGPVLAGSRYIWVTIDGRPVGRVLAPLLESVAGHLREMKRNNGWQVEIVCCRIGEAAGDLFPGLSIFTGPCRFSRPVICLVDNKQEWIGPTEQRHMTIAASDKDVANMADQNAGLNTSVPEQLPVDFTHKETSVTAFLSLIASLTPFSNHNQSPRNMYQCQMLKQTMAIPYLNHVHRTDNKVYRITYPQAPVVRTSQFSATNFDTKPNGTNAVVAVIAHSGYDMEDALIINKQSYERGFKHASVFKTKVIETASDKMSRGNKMVKLTNTNPADANWEAVVGLQADGLPPLGKKMTEGNAIACLFDVDANKKKIEKFKDGEDCWIEQINLVGGGGTEEGPNGLKDGQVRVSIKMRIPRNPVVGDKFASRHGQKGVMGFLWPQEDMPFMAGGFSPDILFNPHGFPSRMTIGMLIESIAGKAAVVKGQATVDATTFRNYPDGKNAHEYFGEQLRSCGYEYLGTEEMYSGVHGTLMTCNIFVGVIYYQRLRHMVLDKAQVRATGPIDPLTRQPVKGRKRHGGIRFGEMERDSLLSHGVSFLLRDRLLRCSDAYTDSACQSCGTILTNVPNKAEPDTAPVCIACGSDCVSVPIPFVFRYLCAELASMNIGVKLELEDNNKDSMNVL